MRSSGSLIIVAPLLLAASAASQNLVTNGAFDKGRTGWTFSGYAVQPKVMNFNTSGTAVSASFSCRPGSKANSLPPGGTYVMEQKVQLVRALPHFLTADVAITNTLPLTNVDAGTIEFHVDQVLVGRAKYKAIHANETLRRKVCIRFVPTRSVLGTLKITFSRAWGAQLQTPRHHIDSISLLRLPLTPLLCPRLERKIGGSLTLDAYGQASAPFVVWVSGSAYPPIAIPGFFGSWSLGLPPRSMPILAGAFDASGAWRATIPLPASLSALAGVPLHWQGIEFTTSRFTIGTHAAFGIYK